MLFNGEEAELGNTDRYKLGKIDTGHMEQSEGTHKGAEIRRLIMCGIVVLLKKIQSTVYYETYGRLARGCKVMWHFKFVKIGWLY